MAVGFIPYINQMDHSNASDELQHKRIKYSGKKRIKIIPRESSIYCLTLQCIIRIRDEIISKIA